MKSSNRKHPSSTLPVNHPSGTRYWLLVPSTFRKRGQALMHRQCWCWGQDVRREEGNALLHLGFERTRPPQDVTGATMYSIAADEKHSVALWGFGMGFCQKCRGGIFLGRFLFAPRYSDRTELPSGIWESAQLDGFETPASLETCETAIELMSASLNWIANYEARVLDEFGLEYRARTLKKWSHHSIDPLVAPQAWRDLSSACRNKIRIFHRDESGVHEVDAALRRNTTPSPVLH